VDTKHNWRLASASMIGLMTLLALALLDGATARAATFTVSTVQIFLSAHTKSEILTVRNASDAPIRFQASVFAWDQSAQGEMALAATRDIVLFPTLFALKPGEERNLRVGTATPPAANEKTYRLFIEELPGQTSESGTPGQVTIRTRLGIPIFIRPPKEVVAGRVEQVETRGGRLTFSIRNAGTVHFLTQAIHVTGLDAAGETVLETKLEGWYVLAGGTRLFDLELPADTCPRLKTVAIAAHTPQTSFTERVDLPSVACRP
jgi:fimbrial chaperone protein